MTAVPIVSRAQWGAKPPTAKIALSHRLTLPTPELWLHHTAGNEHGPAGMRAIQATHMNARGWGDIGYSFVVDPTTNAVYEGRGAGVVGAHTEGRNSRSHGICVMGNYDTTQPTAALIRLVAALVAHGHTQGWWPDHLTGGHRDTKATACPGRYLQAAIRRINSEAEAILAGDITPEPQEAPGMAPTSARDTPIGLAQQAVNAWLPEARRIAVDGDWGQKSTDALRYVLDTVAAPYITELETQVQQLSETNTALQARNTDLLAQINAAQAGAGLDANTVALATIGAKTKEWVETVTAELAKFSN